MVIVCLYLFKKYEMLLSFSFFPSNALYYYIITLYTTFNGGCLLNYIEKGDRITSINKITHCKNPR